MLGFSITDPDNFGSLINLVTGILATAVGVATLLITLKMYTVAVRALNTWRDQKDHDLIIRALARSRKAKWYISNLRNPVSIDTELGEELKLKLDALNDNLKRAFYPQYLITARRKANDKFLEEISDIYELCYAQLKELHVLTRFYKCIIDTDNKVAWAAHNFAVTEQMIASGDLERGNYRDEIKEYRKTIYQRSGDEVSKEIEESFDEVEQFRMDFS